MVVGSIKNRGKKCNRGKSVEIKIATNVASLGQLKWKKRKIRYWDYTVGLQHKIESNIFRSGERFNCYLWSTFQGGIDTYFWNKDIFLFFILCIKNE